MSTWETFNKTFKTEFFDKKSEVSIFFENEFKKTKRINYYGFFDDFLLKYGIHAFDIEQDYDSGKYIPYLNFRPKNIFNEDKTSLDLSDKPKNHSECELLIAKYLISKLLLVDLNVFLNWEKEDTHINI